MKSEKLERKFKWMYKQDIQQLKEALSVIYKDLPADFTKQNDHFCCVTSKKVRKFKNKH